MLKNYFIKGIALLATVIVTFSVSAQYIFTGCGQTGRTGPTQGQANTTYTSTSLDGAVTINVQGIQEWVVPASGTYSIEAFGAKGGGTGGGNGAYVYGEFALTSGQTIRIIVGQRGGVTSQGSGYCAGGGGASYVFYNSNDANPLIVAAGGGGQSENGYGNIGIGGIGSATATTTNSSSISGNAPGGTSGNGGSGGLDIGDYSTGGGGAGWLTNGQDGLYIRYDEGKGGLCPLNGSVGGLFTHPSGYVLADGGFGGGGGGSDNTGAGGGGAGYNGGGGGNNYLGSGEWGAGGGGASYNAGSNQTGTSGTNVGEGFVIITFLCNPTSITPDLVSLPDLTDECAVSLPTAPTATNNCSGVATGIPDVTFPIATQGTTVVTWTYDDGAGNVTTQTQNVIINDQTNPVPDLVSLPDLNDQCEVISLIAPTATDNCAGTITGTHDAILPITASGTTVVTWTFDDGNGNLSTQTQNVVNPTINTGVTQDGSMLYSDALVASYQWLDCDNSYAEISGEVNQFYEVTSSGNYTVQITQDGCVDTSACILVDLSGLDVIEQSIGIYPNPSTGVFTVESDQTIELLELYDLVGRKVQIKQAGNVVTAAELANGKYILRMVFATGTIQKEIQIFK